MNNKLIQIELWLDCFNDCKFCCLGSYSKKTSNNFKIKMVKRAIQFFEKINWEEYNEFAIIGGELFSTNFNGELKNLFDSFIDKIISQIKKGSIKKFYIMTSLIFSNDYFFEILNKFKKEGIQDYIMINTSFDTKYRFNDNKKIYFYKNLDIIKQYSIPIHIETILSDFFIDSYLNHDDELYNIFDNYNVDMLRPTIAWKGVKENMPLDFFPKRSKFYKLLPLLQKQHPNIYNRLLKLDVRAESVYVTINNDIIKRDQEKYIESQTHLSLPCGHDSLYQCYSDSDKCMVCDLLSIKKMRM